MNMLDISRADTAISMQVLLADEWTQRGISALYPVATTCELTLADRSKKFKLY